MLLAPLLFLLLFFFATTTFAATPSNTMTFGGMSSNLPGKEFGEYFKSAFPEMKKVHGEPFSTFTFTIEGRPDIAPHGGGWFPAPKKVIEDITPMRNYQAFLDGKTEGGKTAGINSVEQSVTHELAHAMYTYGNKVISFPYGWANEGWAKTTELLTWMRIKKDPPRPGIYLTQYLDKDTIAGTQALGRYKQDKNHAIIYDNLTINTFNLLYGCSGSSGDPDFQIRMDNKIYDDYVTNKKPLFMDKAIPETEYKSLIKSLCAGKKIDGEDAYEWYFSQPTSLSGGSTGFHLGLYPRWWAYTTVEGIDVYTFVRNQNTNDSDKSEKGLSAAVSVEVFDVSGNSVFSKSSQTDENGNFNFNFGRDLLKNGAYQAIAKSNFGGKQYLAKMFFINIRDADGTSDDQKSAEITKANGVIGVMVDKNLKPLASNYLSLVKPLNGAKVTVNSNGLFLAEVSNPATHEIAFDFLGTTYTFTKPPFRRVVVLKVSDDQIKKAENTSGFKNFADKGFAKTLMQSQARSADEPKTPFERLIEMIMNFFKKGG